MFILAHAPYQHQPLLPKYNNSPELRLQQGSDSTSNGNERAASVDEHLASSPRLLWRLSLEAGSVADLGASLFLLVGGGWGRGGLGAGGLGGSCLGVVEGGLLAEDLDLVLGWGGARVVGAVVVATVGERC